ncbi:MAG: 3-hydroxybutyrate dehydrogenase [Gammaproteobacteria bacterium]|nr:3-hydroxybutyrate dehydrogenase [Gammaproteobacteria bacterium]
MSKTKLALITGSTSGIGLATAQVLAKAGYNIVLTGLVTLEEGEALAQIFRDDYKIKALFHEADMSQPDTIRQMYLDIHNQMGNVDILVNNAGIQHTESLEKFPVEKWDAIIAINLSASFHTMQNFLPDMQKNNWGRVINISSVHGLVASVNKAAYVSAKHGLVGLTKVAALENAAKGITVNAICPGWVETPLIRSQIDDIARAQNISFSEAEEALITAKQPRPEMCKTSEIGELVLYLCSDVAKGITGTSIPIDGGWTAQ